MLRRASEAFEAIYGWPTVVAEDKLDAEYGAPPSGGPPYDVYEITPTTKAFGLPTDGESFTPTRWRFDYRRPGSNQASSYRTIKYSRCCG